MEPTATSDDLILTIDVGTQSTRAAVVDLVGEILHIVKTPAEPYFSDQPGWAEQHADYYWNIVAKSCQQVLSDAGTDVERIAAVAITTQRGTYVNVDAQGTALRPAIVWLDQRKASSEGIIPSKSVPLLKLLKIHHLVDFAVGYSRSNWIRQNQPSIWDQTHKFLCLSGYLTHQLTGQFRDSVGNIIGTMPFDVKRSDWAHRWDPKHRMFRVEAQKLPELVKVGEILGHITEEASAITGIKAGLPLIAASNDKACEMLGAGSRQPADAFISYGTIATINTHNRDYVELKRLLPPYPSAIPDEYYSEIGVTRGLWMVSWFKEEFGLQERLQEADDGVRPEVRFDELIKEVPPGSMGLMLQPYWTPGPDLETYAKGSIIGFGDVHTRAHMYRAIIEGLAYALKEGAQLTAKKNGVEMKRVFVSGGGSQSDQILQVTADIFNLPVVRPHTHETSIIGAAIDAAVGMGAHPDFESAVTSMTRVGRVFEPIPKNAELYAKLYERVYLKMYDRLLPLFKEIQEITGYPEGS